jgi:TonB family protein
MTKTKKKKAALLKLLFVVPTAMILTLFFSFSVTNKVVAQVEKSTKQVQQKQEPTKSLSDENQMKKETPVKSKEIKDAYVVPEDMPQFPGGEEARIKYMADNIKYPENALKNGINGRVFITFVVEKDGSITGVEMLRGFDKECDAEAMRVVKMMPNWTPGRVKGQPVRTVFNMPISFKLDDKGEKEVKNREVKDPPPPPKK